MKTLLDADDSCSDSDLERRALELFSGGRAHGLKSDVHTMEFPFFILDRKDRRGERSKKIFEDSRTGIRVEVRPDPILGGVTIYDKEIMVYISTLMLQALDKNIPVPNNFSFVVSDLLKALGRATGGHDYEELEKSLQRLHRTGITTNIRSGGKIISDEFSLIQRIVWKRDEATKKLERVTVVVSDWFFGAIQAKEVLTIQRSYFDLAPYERRLYEIVRKHCGDQTTFQIGLDRLREKSGSPLPSNAFKSKIKKLIGPTYLALLDYFVIFSGVENKVYAFQDSPQGRAALAKAIGKKSARATSSRAIAAPSGTRAINIEVASLEDPLEP